MYVVIIKVSHTTKLNVPTRAWLLSVPMPSRLISVKELKVRDEEPSLTWNRYGPYPRLRGELQLRRGPLSGVPEMEDAVHLFDPSKRSQDRKSFLTQRVEDWSVLVVHS